MSEEVRFQIQGSAPDPYVVTFVCDGSLLNASCTCPAGVFKGLCKHRLRILAGDASAIVSGNAADVALVRSWMAGSPLEEALADLTVAELAAAEAQKVVSRAKKKIGRVMNGPSHRSSP